MTDTLALHEAAESIEDFGLRSRVKTACHEINRLRSAVEHWEDQVATLREALEDLSKTARLLYANAEGCAVNHYGEDYSIHGLPGWLRDSQAAIERARQALAKTEAGR